jgi:hypothetical protein
MHQNIHRHPRVLHGAGVRRERRAVQVACSVLRGERSREAPDLPGARAPTNRNTDLELTKGDVSWQTSK